MAFDLNAYRAAHRPWRFTAGRHAFDARHVSALECQRFDQMIADAGKNTKQGERAVRWILRRAFPWRGSYLLRGDPVALILRLEPAARAEAIRDFFTCLRGPTQIQTFPQRQKMNGTRSPAPTPSLTRR